MGLSQVPKKSRVIVVEEEKLGTLAEARGYPVEGCRKNEHGIHP